MAEKHSIFEISKMAFARSHTARHRVFKGNYLRWLLYNTAMHFIGISVNFEIERIVL